MKRLLGIAAAASALVLAVSGCANYSSDSSDSTTASDGKVALVQDGKLTVCTHLAYKPFQFKDDKNVTVGFDVDMMDLVAKDLGVKQEIVDIEFEQITSGAVFAADKCDVGAAAITITDEQMANFRVEIVPNYAPAEICGKQVVDVDRRDGVKFYLEGDAWVMMRPSGTEPLVRVYAEAETVDAVFAHALTLPKKEAAVEHLAVMGSPAMQEVRHGDQL